MVIISIAVILIYVILIAICKAGGRADEIAGYKDTEDELWKKKM